MTRAVALLILAAGALLLTTGCAAGTGGVSKNTDASSGAPLFKQACGSCHTLKAAGTQSTVGPDLDAAFGPVRDQGFEQSTIQQVVLDQIRFPSCAPKIRKDAPSTCMPPDLVTGEDAEAVAAYVAYAAGNPEAQQQGGGEITTTNGKEIFVQAGCGGCHVLKDASSTGAVGPNLDQSKPSKELAVDRITNGRGAMPAFKERLTEEQINAVATYVADVAGK